MTTKLFALSATAAALAVSGCSSTSPTPPPEPSPLTYSALRITPGGSTTQTGTGTIGGTPQNATVQVGNATYSFSGSGVPDDSVNGIDVYTYPSYRSGAAILDGQYATAALVSDNVVSQQSVAVLNGQATSPNSMPIQSANYQGLWSIADSAGNSEGGQFAAGVNFDARTYGMDLYNGQGNIPLGTGSGVVQGTGFTGNLSTQGAFVSTNRVDGQFYGPGAAEMGGLIRGQTASGATAGALVGARQ